MILGTALTALSWIDFKTYRLPNALTLPLIALGLLQAFAFKMNIYDSLIGAAVGYLCFVAIEVGFKYFRGKDGLGRGDAKLLAAAGAWCGWANLPFVVLIASGTGLMMLLLPSFRRISHTGRIPFGPFLAFGFFLVWSAGLAGG